MASRFCCLESGVLVKLTGVVDAFDILTVHKDVSFINHIRKTCRVVYDYSHADDIAISLDDLTSFAKLAGIESIITPDIIIGVVTKDDAHRYGTEIYKRLAEAAGASVRILSRSSELLGPFDHE